MSASADPARWPPRPMLSTRFFKGHGLGNDYLVFETSGGIREEEGGWVATPENVVRVCDPHRGLGSDGIVVVGGVSADADTRAGHARVDLRMFNPDGGEFERSGNGLRVLASWLARRMAALETIDAAVGGGGVRMRVHGRAAGTFDVSVEMGRAETGPAAVEAESGLLQGDGPAFVLAGPDGAPLDVVPVSVGNPHLVVLTGGAHGQPFTEQRLAELGPFLATHPGIPHGTNVQLARQVEGRAEAYIWERGVGRTSASGTSSCAVAVALVLVGAMAPGHIPVEMPGGTLTVTVDQALDVVLRGPVASVMSGTLEPGLVATFEPGP